MVTVSRREGTSYTVDLADPRAPAQALWNELSASDRQRILDELPCEFQVSQANPPEGDPHFEAKIQVRDVLQGYFRRVGRNVYVGCELPIYYPAERMFAPDIMAVVDVSTHARNHWTVSAEGKGLDLAMEILYAGRRHKDLKSNAEKFARLRIPEYFVFDRKQLRLHGYHLASSRSKAYEPMVPQQGRYVSSVLGLELALEGERLRFFHGFAPLPDSEELIARLGAAVDAVVAKQEAAEHRAAQQAKRAQEAERKLAEALEELRNLRGKPARARKPRT